MCDIFCIYCFPSCVCGHYLAGARPGEVRSGGSVEENCPRGLGSLETMHAAAHCAASTVVLEKVPSEGS